MVEFEELRLINTHLFKDQRFKLSATGISVIYGKNLNDTGNTNFVGKSLFFSMLGEVIFGVTGEAKDKTRSGKRVLKFKKDGQVYTVINQFSPTEKLRIFKGKEDMGFRELAAARQHLLSLIGFSHEEFETLVYLDSRVPHPLVRGNTATRRAFFTEFFRLDSATAIKDLISAELREVDRAKVRVEEIDRQLEELTLLSKQELAEKRAFIESSEKTRTSLTEKVASYKNLEQQIQSLTDSLDEDLIEEASKHDAETLKAKINKSKQALAQIESLIPKVVAYDKWLAAKQSYEELASALKEEINEELPERESVIESLSRVTERLKEAKEPLEDLKDKRSILKASIHKGSTVCQTCGQKLPHKKDYTEHNERVKAKIAKVEASLEDLTEEVQKLEAKEAKLRDLLQQIKNSDTAKKSLSKLQKPVPVENPEQDMDDLLAQQKKQQSRLELCSELLRMQGPLAQIEKLKRQLDSNAYKEDLTKLDNLNSQIKDAEFDVEQDLRNRQQRRELKERRTSLVADSSRETGLRILEKAYSKRGIQSLMIKAICERLEALVNRFASLVFSESYSFSFSLDSQLNITCTRKLEGKELVSDVRKLSGAESTLFGIILLLALYSFLPAAKRCNLLVLDEPDANMGSKTQESFIRFLSVLNKVIPHIIVITPNMHGVYHDAHIWTVVKQGAFSTIESSSEWTTKQ